MEKNDMEVLAEAEYFNKLADKWDEIREVDDVKLSELVQLLHLKQDDEVLDIGSGTGVLLPYLAPLVKTVTAVDFAAHMLAKAQEKCARFSNIFFSVSDVLAYEPERTFDKITCLNFYPHIRDKRLFVERADLLLAENGEITIMHDLSRQQVNDIHGSSAEIADDRLREAAAEAEIFQANGFSVKRIIENDSCYFLQLRKNRKQAYQKS